MGRPEYWTEDRIKSVSIDYEFISDLARDHQGAYGAIKTRHRHLKEELFPVYKKLIWTEDKVITEALKYSTRKDFRTLSNGAYSRAFDLGIIDKACSHMRSVRLKEGRLDLQKHKGLSGLYFLYNKGEIVYIGKSNNCMIERVRYHYPTKTFDKASLNIVKNLTDLHVAEVYLISKHKPLYNNEFNYSENLTLEIKDIESIFIKTINVSASFGVNYANINSNK